MLLFFTSFYNWLNTHEALLRRFRVFSVLRFSTRHIANICLMIYFYITRNNPKYKLDNSCDVIVSLTSFPRRIGKLWMVIETLLRQDMKPSSIILWLSKEQFSSIEVLPGILKKMQRRGLVIRLCENDIRSHKKYYYAIKEFPNKTLVTVDDDILYRPDLISSLVKLSIENPNCIIADYAHLIKRDNGIICPYREWPWLDSALNDVDVFFGSGGGTLYPPGSLHKEVTNITACLKLCPYADDIWLNAMARLQNTRIIKTQGISDPLLITTFNNYTLASVNYDEGNDNQLRDIRNYYLNKLSVDPFSIKK